VKIKMLTNTTIADIYRPRDKADAILYDIVLIIISSLLIGISAQIAIGWPVPFTMQTFAVLMTGALFGAKRGSMIILLYLAEGAAGLPVFSAGRGGLVMFAGPTGGYLAGFLAAAIATGFLAQKGWDRKISTTILAMIVGNILIYAFGLCWLSYLEGLNNALTMGLYPFIAGDLIKVALAATLLPGGWRILGHLGL
jgi:biotin transport system substrate-specific component